LDLLEITEKDPGILVGALALLGTLKLHGLVVQAISTRAIPSATGTETVYTIPLVGKAFLDRLADDSEIRGGEGRHAGVTPDYAARSSVSKQCTQDVPVGACISNTRFRPMADTAGDRLTEIAGVASRSQALPSDILNGCAVRHARDRTVTVMSPAG
jgi:hypothetical protein